MTVSPATPWPGWLRFIQPGVLTLFVRFWHRCRGELSPLPPDGPVLLVANHASHVDPGFVQACCPRPVCFFQARECYEVPLLCWLFRRVGCIPVRRGVSDVGGVREALRRLRQGEVVCLFPEGEVGDAGGGTVGRGKTGAALLALRSGAPVFPARILGGPRSRHPIGAWLWPSPGVRIILGPQVELARYRGRRITRQILREVTDLIMRHIDELGTTRHGHSAGAA